MWSDRHIFLHHWNFARSRNTVDAKTIKRVIKQFKRHPFRISGKADKYLNDLNAEIDLAQKQRQLCSPQQLARMQHFLASGDPILVAEATAWFYIQSQRS
jgi:hypothetical protein